MPAGREIRVLRMIEDRHAHCFAVHFAAVVAPRSLFAPALAFTFAAVQPVLGAAADLFGKVRLMIGCLVLLGVANILGAAANSFPLLFAPTKIEISLASSTCTSRSLR